MLPLESVPNFSEGRDEATIDAIGSALGAHARLLDVHADADHNRSVFTLVGTEAELADALLAGIAVAVERIDLRTHEGAHPRIGAADVVPIVPLRPRTSSGPARPRSPSGSGSARSSDCRCSCTRRPSEGRRSIGAAGRRNCSGASTTASSSPTTGPRGCTRRQAACIVGRARPLIAFNVNLRGDVGVAREIAAVVRERGGGFPGVRALGLDLPRAGLVQVS